VTTPDTATGSGDGARRAPRGRAPRLGYMPGIDGLRALAVGTVVLYHAGTSWIPGGFLGVDVFLVISGYLITSLLLAELEATGRINLGRFWLARARRLLPAVLVMVLVVLGVMALLHPGEVGALRGAVLASVFYVTNWYQIAAHQSYFAQYARPSVFQHLWSLAVEEQFYLLWPPIMAVALNYFGRRRLVYGVVVGTACSTVLAAVLFSPGHDPSRIYYGTDTRAAGLLVGVLLAFAWPAARLAPVRNRQAAVLLDASGLAALVALLAIMCSLGEFSATLYRGGFLVVALVTAVLLAVVAHPSSKLGKVFALAPLVWIGKRSYGIYLWHWPVLMLTRANQDVPFGGPVLLAIQLGLTVGMAELSYRFIEVPIRREGIAGVRKELAGVGLVGQRARVGAATASMATIALVCFVAVAPARSPAPPVIPASAGAGAGRLVQAAPTLTAAQIRARFNAQVRAGRIIAIGDSVMLGAKPALTSKSVFGGHAYVDAVEGRQFTTAPALVARYVRTKRPHMVIIHLGNNGTVTFADMQAMMNTLRTVPVVVLVTLHVARSWEASDNRLIRYEAAHHSNVALADWHTLSAGRTGIFWDGIHVNSRGAALYAAMLIRAIGTFGAPTHSAHTTAGATTASASRPMH
jgi:peptidoglycan/LPS O-acetylase OafA/YrhL